MTRFKLFSFALFAFLLWSSCQKENLTEITDNPPVVVPDTTVHTYFGNLSLGNDLLPIDTIFTEMQMDSMLNPGENLGYDLQAMVGPVPSFYIHWEAHDPTEEKIKAGTYNGCCAVALKDSFRMLVQQWIINGRNPNTFPQLDTMSFNLYDAPNVSITISNIEEAVRVEQIGNDSFIVDRARVQLNGIMTDINTNSPKVLSGNFICYFGRRN